LICYSGLTGVDGINFGTHCPAFFWLNGRPFPVVDDNRTAENDDMQVSVAQTFTR